MTMHYETARTLNNLLTYKEYACETDDERSRAYGAINRLDFCVVVGDFTRPKGMER